MVVDAHSRGGRLQAAQKVVVDCLSDSGTIRSACDRAVDAGRMLFATVNHQFAGRVDNAAVEKHKRSVAIAKKVSVALGLAAVVLSVGLSGTWRTR
jgi:hypothetical protein